jgi:hypothetical protein
MTWRWLVTLCLVSGVSVWQTGSCANAASPPPQQQAENAGQNAGQNVGQIVGQLSDSRGHIVFGGHVAVFLCDAATGIPIHRETKQPINATLKEAQLDKMWVVEADEKSSYEFVDVPVGKYRLVAQSWSGTKGFPGFGSDMHPSAFLILHGVAEAEVRAGERTLAYVRQLGDHVLRIVNDPEEPHALLLISLKPTLGDGILGPWGWGKEFCRNLIGATQMEVGHVTIVGLPADAAVHVGLLNYDNNPGVGAASFQPGQREGKLRIVASWSDGHKDPPPELAALVGHLEKNEITLASLLPAGLLPAAVERPLDPDAALMAAYNLLMKENEKQVAVPGLGEKRLADVLAAYAYIEMRKRRR